MNTQFWKNKSKYEEETYVSKPFTEEDVMSLEKDLGYIIPSSYKDLMKTQNGGVPHATVFTQEEGSAAGETLYVNALFGIGNEKDYSLGGVLGSKHMITEWGYPDIGIYFADTPSAGHDMFVLDYRKNGRDGEPEVAHVDQEREYAITLLAKDFKTFIEGLTVDPLEM